MAAILTIARFCEPSSELHIEEKWYRRTALEELLGAAPEKVHTDRLYETFDRLPEYLRPFFCARRMSCESHMKFWRSAAGIRLTASPFRLIRG